jgi:CTP:molybdopterin cytidylyltransferase MocA
MTSYDFRFLNMVGRTWAGKRRSVRVGLRALELDEAVGATAILPGDQPLVRPEVIGALLDALDADPSTPFVVPRYADDGAPNPIVARRSIWRLADDLAGDRGFGPLLATHPELVRFVDVDGSNPDVDTRADLERLAASDRPPADVS